MSPSAPIEEADLVAFADGRIEPGREAEMRARLQLPENAAANERVERWRAQNALLRSALDPIAAEPAPPKLLAVIASRAARRWPVAAMAATLAGILIGVGGGWALWGGEPAAASEIAAIGISAHEVFANEVRHPVEVGTDEQAHLVNWLSNRLDLPIRPPDLSADGLTLLGGRLIPKDGEAAAQLMYEDASGRRFTLLIARTEEPVTTAFRYAWVDGACAYYWMDGAVGYVFVGPDDRELVWRLSRSVYDQLS